VVEDSINIALYSLVATGIAIIIALYFNIQALRQNSKNHQYQITKDFFKEFHDIQNIPLEKVSVYVQTINNFTHMALGLHKSKIIDKSMITGNLRGVFEESYWIHSNITKGERDSGMIKFDEWCDENEIKPKPLVDERKEFIAEIVAENGALYVNYK